MSTIRLGEVMCASGYGDALGTWVGGVGPDPDHASHAACEDNGCREMTVARVEESVLVHLLAGQAVNPILWPPFRGYDNLDVHGAS